MKQSEVKAKIIKDEPVPLQDGLENLAAQLGTTKDKRNNSRFVAHTHLSGSGSERELANLYRYDWAAGKIVDIIPEDMCREWRKFVGDIKPDVIELLVEEEERLELRTAFETAHKWARLYGTAFIILAVDDGEDPRKPLNIEKLKPGSLKHIKVVDRTQINRENVIPTNDPFSVNYGFPECYRLNETVVDIHHSRMLRFDGIKLPWYEFRENNYVSDSILARLYDSLLNFNTVSQSSASMVFESNVDIVKINNLMNQIATKQGEELIRKRFSIASSLKSFNNMLLLDSQEDFEQKTITFAGLNELLMNYALFLSGAGDVPATRLLGSAASGLNATGEGDLKNYYDTARSNQVKVYKPKLDYFDKIMAASLGLKDENLQYTFNPLFQMTPEQIANINKVEAETAATYIDRDVVTVSTVAKELKEKGTYTNITDEHIAELEAYEGENDVISNTEGDIDKSKQETEEGEEETIAAGENVEEGGS